MDDVTAPRWTTAPAAVLLLDLDEGQVSYANPAARELVQDEDLPLPATTWEEGVGLRDADGEPFEEGRSPVARLLAGDEVREEPVTIPREGEPLVVLATGHPLPADVEGPRTALLVFVEPPEPGLEGGLQERALAAAGWSFAISDPHQPDDPLVWVNPAFTELTGYELEDVIGRNCRFLQGEETDPDAVQRIREGIARREHRVTVLRNYRKDGTAFFNEVAISPVFDGDGRLTHFVGVQKDVTRRVQGERTRRVRLAAEQLAREEAEAQQERFELLAEATTLLGDVADVDDALSRLTSLLVGRAGDWCRIDLRDGAELGRWSAWSDVDGHAHAERLADQRVEDLPLGAVVGDVLAGGPPRLVTRVDSDLIATGSGVAAVEGLEGGSAVVVPLGARHRARGALTVARRRGGDPYSRGDLQAFVELAGRAGIALENVLLRAAQRTSALELQTGLLPRLADVEGFTWAVRYLPGAAGERVGGDWYDLFHTDDGDVALSVGDVVGHDMAAAAAMSQMRASLRAFAWTFADPGDVLARLDQLASRLEIAELTTAIYGRVSSVADGLTFHYANAGHPPALLRTPDGAVRRLDDGGSTVLGLDVGHRPSAQVALPPGSFLVLYTDGLVERRGEPVDEGIDRLAAALRTADGLDADEVAEHLLAEAGAGASQDDVATLVLCVD